MQDLLLKIRKEWITCPRLQSVWVTVLEVGHELQGTRKISGYIWLPSSGGVFFSPALREHLAKIYRTWNLNTNLQALWFRFHRPVLLPKYVLPASPADRLESSYCVSAGITSTDHWSLVCYGCKQIILVSNLNFVNSVYGNKLQKSSVFSCLGNGFPLPLC